MRRLVLASVAAYVSATCQEEALKGFSDSEFNWLIKGNSSDRKNNVTAVCASNDNPARTAFLSRLNTINTACGTGQTSPFGMTVSLLTKVLCERKETDTESNFCLLSLLPLFDFGYFLGLSGGDYKPPPLKSVAEDLDRQTTMCHSDVCYHYVEQLASSVLRGLPAGNESATAEKFIRDTVKQMRCGCAVKETPCAGALVTDELLSSDKLSFIESKACDAAGIPTACARTWINCEGIPPPVCAKPCNGGMLANVTFLVKNLDWECVKIQLTTEALSPIRADVIANVRGLLNSDFTCDCAASTAPVTGTNCTCSIRCLSLSTVLNLRLADALKNLKTHSDAVVISTPKVDSLVRTCQVTQDDFSFGKSFQLLEVKSSIPLGAETENSAAYSVALGLSAIISVCLSLVL